jgi:FtsP/CotA-like multicopper oxidase with cupredoxin domain
MAGRTPNKALLLVSGILIVVGIAVAAYSAATTEWIHEETIKGVASNPKEWGGILTGLGIAAVGFITYRVFRTRSEGPGIPLQVVGPDGATVNTTLEELMSPENLAKMEAAQRSEILTNGASGQATILQAVPTPKTSPTTGVPLHFVRLTVQVDDGRPTFEVMTNYGVPEEKAAAVKVGATLPVKVLSNDASGVAIDWDSV